MTLIEERTARLETERENEQEWRREILARLEQMDTRQNERLEQMDTRQNERLEQIDARQNARLDRLEGNLRWILGATILLHSVTIGAIFAAAALF